MQYRYLGRPGLLVSRVRPGTMPLGMKDRDCDQETADQIVKANGIAQRQGWGRVISRCLAQMPGGEITVESNTGRGSTFAVTIRTGSLQGDDFASAGAGRRIASPGRNSTGHGFANAWSSSSRCVSNGQRKNTRRSDKTQIMNRSGVAVILLFGGRPRIGLRPRFVPRCEPFGRIVYTDVGEASC